MKYSTIMHIGVNELLNYIYKVILVAVQIQLPNQLKFILQKLTQHLLLILIVDVNL